MEKTSLWSFLIVVKVPAISAIKRAIGQELAPKIVPGKAEQNVFLVGK